jgi:predicted nucleotidyltransferase
VADAPILSADELRFLRVLHDKGVEYLVVGLAAAALQGAPLVTQDVDLWFRDLSDPKLMDALRDVGGAYVPPVGLNPPTLAGAAVRLFDVVVSMHGLRSFAEERAEAARVEVGGVSLPVLPLARIIASKTALGRDKDRLVLPTLEEALRVQKDREKR